MIAADGAPQLIRMRAATGGDFDQVAVAAAGLVYDAVKKHAAADQRVVGGERLTLAWPMLAWHRDKLGAPVMNMAAPAMIVACPVALHDAATWKESGRQLRPAARFALSRQNGIASSMSPPLPAVGLGAVFLTIGGEIGFTRIASVGLPW